MSESIEALTGKSREAILEDLLDSGRSVTPVEYIARTEIIRLTARIAELETAHVWRDIRKEPAPENVTVILANFEERCLLTGAPHVWTATWVTEWTDGDGTVVTSEPMWCECSHAATNENGMPTHWMPRPPDPDVARTTLEASKQGTK